MYTAQHKYTVIDLDPYGTAAPVPRRRRPGRRRRRAAVRDVAPTRACSTRWGTSRRRTACTAACRPKGPHCHEGGVRLILHAIAAAAGKYGIATEPLLALSIDFYARVFVRLRRSAGATSSSWPRRPCCCTAATPGAGRWTTQPLVRACTGTRGGAARVLQVRRRAGLRRPRGRASIAGSSCTSAGRCGAARCTTLSSSRRMLSSIEELDPERVRDAGEGPGDARDGAGGDGAVPLHGRGDDAADAAGRSTAPPAPRPEKDADAPDEPASRARLCRRILSRTRTPSTSSPARSRRRRARQRAAGRAAHLRALCSRFGVPPLRAQPLQARGASRRIAPWGATCGRGGDARVARGEGARGCQGAEGGHGGVADPEGRRGGRGSRRRRAGEGPAGWEEAEWEEARERGGGSSKVAPRADGAWKVSSAGRTGGEAEGAPARGGKDAANSRSSLTRRADARRREKKGPAPGAVPGQPAGELGPDAQGQGRRRGQEGERAAE